MTIHPPPTREPASGSMYGFHPINPNHLNSSEVNEGPNLHNLQDATPTTPRPNTAPNIQPKPMHGVDDATTPMTATSRATSNALANQRQLPLTPFDVAASVPETVEGLTSTLNRGNSTKSNNSGASEDVDMDESDDGNDNGDGSKPNKKKKAIRFFCTDHPPCNLSFTRSEHLARHIRKHTGERPFTCHCHRKFSRLDNLRQHAQTVHVNEPIPHDSLAASGTRYPRQARSDRVRPSQTRPRAATASAQAPPYRGHQRNSLSTSSIGTIASTYSQPNFGSRPAPLQTPSWDPNSPSAYRPGSPGDYGTPTSATFSTGQNSPRFPSGLQSPMVGTYSRTAFLNEGHRTPGRRLSTPSAVHPFSSSGLTSPWNTSSNIYSPSMVSSPTASTAGMGHLRRDSMASNYPEMDTRRRTWHPDTLSTAYGSTYTSRMQTVTTPNHYAEGPIPQPSAILPSNAPPMAHTPLPSISTFDHIRREASPPRRASSPMMVDRSNSYHSPTPTFTTAELNRHRQTRPSIVESNSYYQPRPMPARDRPLSSHLDRQFNHLEIQGSSQGDASTWASDAHRAVYATAEQSQANQPRVMFEPSIRPTRAGPHPSYHQHTASEPVNQPRSNRRDGWYNGPGTTYYQAQNNKVGETSPEGSSSSDGPAPITPQSATATDYHPPILRSNGYPEETSRLARPQQPIIHHYHSQSNGGEPSYTYGPSSTTQNMFQPQQIPKSSQESYSTRPDSSRLDVLVAAAADQVQVPVHRPF